jgi:hypothetical protein
LFLLSDARSITAPVESNQKLQNWYLFLLSDARSITAPVESNQKLQNWYLFLLSDARSIKKKEQRLFVWLR